MKIPREEARRKVAEYLWLDERAPWQRIWEDARTLGAEMYRFIRDWVADMLDGEIPLVS